VESPGRSRDTVAGKKRGRKRKGKKRKETVKPVGGQAFTDIRSLNYPARGRKKRRERRNRKEGKTERKSNQMTPFRHPSMGKKKGEKEGGEEERGGKRGTSFRFLTLTEKEKKEKEGGGVRRKELWILPRLPYERERRKRRRRKKYRGCYEIVSFLFGYTINPSLKKEGRGGKTSKSSLIPRILFKRKGREKGEGPQADEVRLP